MGTNYYLRRNVCPFCGRPLDVLHIGKKSAGCSFIFQGYPGIRNVFDWHRLLRKEGNAIYSSDNKKVLLKSFEKMVVDSQKEKHSSEKGYREDEFGYVFLDRDFC